MKLTGNQIRYLLAIYDLSQTKHVVKSIDVANELDLSRASVHKMLKSLKEAKCVKQELYGTLSLTNYGNRLACDYQKKYDLLAKTIKPAVKITDTYNLGLCILVEEM